MVYVFLATGFEEIEALAPVDILRRAGVEVQTVAVNDDITDKVVYSARRIPVLADISISEMKLSDDIQMIVLQGGIPGTTNLENSPDVLAIVDYCHHNNKLIGEICAAPTILGHKGILKVR